jgi:DNA-binding CsgD family transcriptional regulator
MGCHPWHLSRSGRDGRPADQALRTSTVDIVNTPPRSRLGSPEGCWSRPATRAVGEIAELEHLSRWAFSEVRTTVSGYRQASLPAELVVARDPWLAAESLATGQNPLTERERDVLRVAVEGDTIADIAKVPHLSQGTVRNHLSSAIGETGARTRAEATKLTDERGWF